MGSAVWLYGWLVLRQTHQTGGVGWVLGGAPIHYREIEEETGFNPRTLERWMKSLREQKYIATAVVDGGITVKILKAKKHLRPMPHGAGVRKVAGGVRGTAGTVPQKWVAGRSEEQPDQQVAEPIGSSFVVRIKEKEAKQFQPPVEIASQADDNLKPTWLSQKRNHHQSQKQNEAPSWNQPHDSSPRDYQSPQEVQRRATQQQFSWELRERMRLIRAEREEAVRRELAVGTGPEAGRP